MYFCVDEFDVSVNVAYFLVMNSKGGMEGSLANWLIRGATTWASSWRLVVSMMPLCLKVK